MPNIKEFVGPIPEPVHRTELEKVIGKKPCSKCDEDVHEATWDPISLVMSWTCSKGHQNSFKVN
jgi:hypothetical protein